MKTHVRIFAAALGFACLFGFGLSNASAQLQQLPAKEYIDRMNDPNRDLKVDEVIAKLKLKPGDIVADIGSGSRLVHHSFRQSRCSQWHCLRRGYR